MECTEWESYCWTWEHTAQRLNSRHGRGAQTIANGSHQEGAGRKERWSWVREPGDWTELKITANPRASHHHLHTPPQDRGGNRELNHHKHRMRMGCGISLNRTPAFSRPQFYDCSPEGITSTRHVTTARVVTTVQCCVILGEPQKKMPHRNSNSQHWQKETRLLRKHKQTVKPICRAEDRPTGTPAFQREGSAKSLMVFLNGEFFQSPPCP